MNIQCLPLIIVLFLVWGLPGILLIAPEFVWGDGYDYLVVGVMVQGKEVSMLDVLRQADQFLLPLQDFVDVIGCTIQRHEDRIRLLTPLGETVIPPEAIVVPDGREYLRQTWVETALHVGIRFDSAEFALTLVVPWRQHAQQPHDGSPPLAIDIHPPAFSVSTLQQDVMYSANQDDTRTTSMTTLGGRIGDGSWRTQFETDFEKSHDLSEYAWQRSYGNTLAQLGYQRLRLHPLLSGFELTGLQVGWTNQALDRFSLTSEARELLPRHSAFVQTFRGTAAPGHIAQLRVDGGVVAEQVVGLDGQYSFPDVPLASGHLNRVEVYLYDYRDARVPLDIREIILTSSDLLLPDEKKTHAGGIGWQGNLADDVLQPDTPQAHKFTGFYQWRQGISERFTLEASAQHVNETLQLQGGFITRLSHPFILAASLGNAEGDIGYTLDLDGVFSRWRIFARLRRVPEGFFLSEEAEAQWINSFDLSYRIHDRLYTGIKARYANEGDEDIRYLLPFVVAQPFSSVFVRAIPNTDEEYRLDGYVAINSASRLSFLLEKDVANLDLSYQFAPQYGLFAGAEYKDQVLQRYSAMLKWKGQHYREPAVQAGLAVSDKQTQYLISGSIEVFPGITADFNYQHTQLGDADPQEQEHLLRFELSTDFTLSGKQFLPADGQRMERNRGAIAGRVRIEGIADPSQYGLDDLKVSIGERKSVNTDAGGYFFSPNLEADVYVVELDIENLPFELVPEQTAFVVAVAADATTVVDFVVRPEYGIAGRVTDQDGQHLAGVLVEVLDAVGQRLSSAVSDRFGLYRVDGLPPGEYMARIAPQAFTASRKASQNSPNLLDVIATTSPPLAQRQIHIRDAFLFDQDLQLPDSN